MRLVLTLLVRDEEDVLRANLEHHLSLGVDHVVATDNLSVDRTGEILRDYERAGVLHLIEDTRDDFRQAEWVTHMARLARTRFGADWVIHVDADELWMPARGDLRSVLAGVPPEVDNVVVERSNFVPVEDEAAPFYERMVVREVTSLNTLGQPLPPKVCHRGAEDVAVLPGNHGVEAQDPGRTAAVHDLWIAHFPLRSWRQFESKIAKGGAALERNSALPRGVGSTWRALLERHRAGRLEEFYRAQVHGPEALARGIGEGSLTRCELVRDRLRGLQPLVGPCF